jgi:hypothetical protein
LCFFKTKEQKDINRVNSGYSAYSGESNGVNEATMANSGYSNNSSGANGVYEANSFLDRRTKGQK